MSDGRTKTEAYKWLQPDRRKKLTPNQRVSIFHRDNGVCYLCGLPVDPLKQKWDCDHVEPRYFTGSDDLKEFRLAHNECHKDKTREDIKIISKSKRIQQKELGVKKKKSGGFRGWRKFNGDVVIKKR